MSALIFNILRYILLLLFVVCGKEVMNISSIDSKVRNQNYWILLLPPIVLYAFMEGTRWGRGQDYFYNYNIATMKTVSGDIAYDLYAYVLNLFGVPWFFFFVSVSALLICSLYLYIKDINKAIIPTIILLYQFTMAQSENLMRQYAAISLVLVSLYFLYKGKYKKTFVFFVLSYLTHSSVVFMVPFLTIALFLEKSTKIKSNFIFRRLDLVFLVMFVASPILTKVCEANIEFLFKLIGFGFSDKYLSEEYLLKATELSDIENNLGLENSMLHRTREFLRSVLVICVGKRVIDGCFQNDKRHQMMFCSWFLACCGLVYYAALPHLNMEVLARLSLYLRIFVFVVEGVIIYLYILKKTKPRDRYGNLVSWAVFILIIMELVLVLKWNSGSILGLNFIWTL